MYNRNMSTTPISKSQTRALALVGIPQVDEYRQAAQALEAAGYQPDGIPAGQTWRSAAKLNDAELLAGLKREEYARPMSAVDIIEIGCD